MRCNENPFPKNDVGDKDNMKKIEEYLISMQMRKLSKKCSSSCKILIFED